MNTGFTILAAAVRGRLLFAIACELLLTVSAKAQNLPAYQPPVFSPFPSQPFFNFPTRKGSAMPLPGKGSYQTLDSVWHKARISFLAYGIRVDDVEATADPEVAAPLVPLQQVLRIVVRHDTLAFRLVEDDAKAPARPEYYYLKQLYRGGGWTVYSGWLKQPSGAYVAVPTRKAEFQQVMLQHFGNCAPLRKQIEQGFFDASSVLGIVRQYAQWQQTAPKTPQ